MTTNQTGAITHQNGKVITGIHRFGQLEEVVYGRPFVEVVLAQCEKWGLQRVVILSTRSLESGFCEVLARALDDRHLGTFAGISAHTPVASVLDIASSLLSANPDAIVAIGGGSVIDGAKALALALLRRATDEDQLFSDSANALDVQCTSIRLIAVPTTLSGAEFTSMAGVSTSEGRKRRLSHPKLAPNIIILDPVAALQTPIDLWSSTGIRALDHAIEAICSDHCDTLSEAMALRALPLLTSGLLASAGNPNSPEGRLQSQLGMWFACVGPASGVPMGVSHGIGHILGAEYGIAHGITSCVLMTAAQEWNRPIVRERQLVIEQNLGLPGKTVMQKVDNLLKQLHLPKRLSEVGIMPSSFANIAERSMTDFFIPTNPR